MAPERQPPQWRAKLPIEIQNDLFRSSFDGSLHIYGSRRTAMIPHDFRRIALAHELLAPRPAPRPPASPGPNERHAPEEDDAEPGSTAIPAEHDLVD